MSKFELPTQKGTGPLFSQVTQLPVKVVVSGVDADSDAGKEVVSRYSGAVKQFLTKQQQSYSLSDTKYQRQSIELGPDATATYTNNNGMETLEIEVKAGSNPEQPPTPGPRPWDFALIDFTFKGALIGPFLAAYLAKPQTPDEKTMNDDTRMPVQGVTAFDWYSPEKNPVIEFADQARDADIIHEATDAKDMVRSLRVDLRPYPNQIIEVDLYGYIVQGTYVFGGDGKDPDGKQGQLISVTRVGSLTYDYRSYTGAWTPSSLQAAPLKFFTDGTLSSDHLAGTYKTFPELEGFPVVVDPNSGGSPEGDVQISASFHTPGVFAPWHWINDDLSGFGFQDYCGTKPTSVTPDNDPNQWAWRTCVSSWDGVFESLKTYEDWGPGYHKKSTIDCTVFQGPKGVNSADGFGYVSSVPLSLNYSTTSIVSNYYEITYYVPTWYFSGGNFSMTAVCAHLGNPWTGRAHQSNASDSERDTYTFEVPSIYPNRPKMKDIGTGTMDFLQVYPDDGEDFNRPSKFFAAPKIGVLKIDTKEGTVKYEPV